VACETPASLATSAWRIRRFAIRRILQPTRLIMRIICPVTPSCEGYPQLIMRIIIFTVHHFCRAVKQDRDADVDVFAQQLVSGIMLVIAVAITIDRSRIPIVK
jgi:hypothetical protein